jgi:hypothetical protein
MSEQNPVGDDHAVYPPRIFKWTPQAIGGIPTRTPLMARISSNKRLHSLRLRSHHASNGTHLRQAPKAAPATANRHFIMGLRRFLGPLVADRQQSRGSSATAFCEPSRPTTASSAATGFCMADETCDTEAVNRRKTEIARPSYQTNSRRTESTTVTPFLLEI